MIEINEHCAIENHALYCMNIQLPSFSELTERESSEHKNLVSNGFASQVSFLLALLESGRRRIG